MVDEKSVVIGAPRPWELVVIGGGSAGLTAARTARLLGARVLLVERDRLGGDCLWRGCVPSKTLIAGARTVKEARSFAVVHGMGADSHRVFDAVRGARSRIASSDSAESLEALGVTVLRKDARFVDSHALVIDGERVEFRRAVLATGSHPAVPHIPGLDGARPLTSDTVWELDEVPTRLLVIGGGPVGCELAQAFSRLGAEVTLVHRGRDVLAHEEPAARSVIARALAADGVRMLMNRTVSRLETGIKRVAVLDDGVRVPFDRVLVATGRRATVDSLGLLDGGIRQDAAGWVISDASLRTSNRAVWAAGDVTWLPKHTHTAGVSGAIATRNALLGTSKRMASSDQPRVIFTAPEVASVGARARQRHRSGDRVVTIQHRSLDRAVTEGDTSGFTQLVVDRHGRIKGGTIVGPRAGESLGELALAVARRVDVGALASVTHAYPTFNDGLWNAAIAESQRRIRRGLSGRILRVIRRLRSGRTNDGTNDGDLR